MLGAMREWGMETAGVQTDPRLPTGRVSVRFDDGEPNYDIVHPCAYDAIEASALPDVDCGLLYHGSLALRSEVSRNSCEDLRTQKASDKTIVFVDVNLRSIVEVQEALARQAAKSPPGQWVLGVMYDDTKFREGRPLTRKDIDAVMISTRDDAIEDSCRELCHAGVLRAGAVAGSGEA